MPTPRQKKVAKLIIENSKVDKPLTGGEIVESSGYGVSMKKNPQVILNSEGVQQALDDYGFTEDNAKKVVAEILLDEKVDPGNRIRSAQEVFKVKGSYAPEKSVGLKLNIEGRLEDKSGLEALRAEYEQKLKEKLLNEPKSD